MSRGYQYAFVGVNYLITNLLPPRPIPIAGWMNRKKRGIKRYLAGMNCPQPPAKTPSRLTNRRRQSTGQSGGWAFTQQTDSLKLDFLSQVGCPIIAVDADGSCEWFLIQIDRNKAVVELGNHLANAVFIGLFMGF